MFDVTVAERPEQHARFAQVGSAYYPILIAVFTALVIISNVTATKGVAFGPIITDGGFIVFPLTYIIGDVLSEVYGFKAARRAISPRRLMACKALPSLCTMQGRISRCCS